MHYQLWDFFYQPENYSHWRELVRESKGYNLLTWNNIVEFYNVVQQTPSFKNQLAKTRQLTDFIQVAKDNGYIFTVEELAWVLISSQEIWNLFSQAEKNPELQTQLFAAKHPQEFVEVAATYGYYFSSQVLGWLLTDIKSFNTTSIVNSTGDIINVRFIGKISVGQWINFGEDLGIVPPLCHVHKRSKEIGSIFLKYEDEDIDNEKYYLRQCFLPRGYFSQRVFS